MLSSNSAAAMPRAINMHRGRNQGGDSFHAFVKRVRFSLDPFVYFLCWTAVSRPSTSSNDVARKRPLRSMLDLGVASGDILRRQIYEVFHTKPMSLPGVVSILDYPRITQQ